MTQMLMFCFSTGRRVLEATLVHGRTYQDFTPNHPISRYGR